MKLSSIINHIEAKVFALKSQREKMITSKKAQNEQPEIIIRESYALGAVIKELEELAEYIKK